MARMNILGSAAVAALALTLSACGGSNNTSAVAPPPTPTPTPPPTTTTLDVMPCLTQFVPSGLNRTPPGTRILDLVIPDTITIFPDRTVNFPNGRQLADPVVDITLAVVLLDMFAPGQNPATFAAAPLNPAAATKAPLSTFPFANTPNGNPVLDAGNGTNFTFDTADMSTYVQVDRMGMPAVGTALVLGPRKTAYSDGNVQQDTAGTYAGDLIAGLTSISTALQDDLASRGLQGCAVRRVS